MNKFFLITAFVFGLTASAVAKDTTKYFMYKSPNGVIVKVPQGTDVDVDVSGAGIFGRDVDLEVRNGESANSPWYKIW